jgi:hypothetical protein
MSDKSLVDNFLKIIQEKEEECKKLLCQREREAHEVFVANLQTQKVGHIAHFGVSNPTLLQV